MKHFLFLIGLALIVLSCNQRSTQSASQTADTMSNKKNITVPTTNYMTINGYTKMEAGVMVKRFLNNKGIFNRAARTNIWFKKSYLDSLVLALDAEFADGIRVYFAKGSDEKLNIVIVSTKSKKLPNDSIIHQDYFDHTSNFLPKAKGEVDHGKKNFGTRLYEIKNIFELPDRCNPKGVHYVDYSTALKWTKNDAIERSNDTINTKSEWFDIGLLHIVKNDLEMKKHGDGIRIYYVRKTELDKNEYRHHLLIITTKSKKGDKSKHIDYFNCTSSLHEYNASDNGEQCESNCTGTTAW